MPIPFRECPYCGKRVYLRWRDAVIDAHRMNQQQRRGIHMEAYLSRECGGAIHIGSILTGKVRNRPPLTPRQKRQRLRRKQHTRDGA